MGLLDTAGRFVREKLNLPIPPEASTEYGLLPGTKSGPHSHYRAPDTPGMLRSPNHTHDRSPEVEVTFAQRAHGGGGATMLNNLGPPHRAAFADDALLVDDGQGANISL